MSDQFLFKRSDETVFKNFTIFLCFNGYILSWAPLIIKIDHRDFRGLQVQCYFCLWRQPRSCYYVYKSCKQFNSSMLIKALTAEFVWQHCAPLSIRNEPKKIYCNSIKNKNDSEYLLQLAPRTWTVQPSMPLQQTCFLPLLAHSAGVHDPVPSFKFIMQMISKSAQMMSFIFEIDFCCLIDCLGWENTTNWW